MKNYKMGQHFYCDDFNNDAFCIYCSTKGWWDGNQNTFSFGIKLLRLPIGIAMKTNFMNHNVDGIKTLSYDENLSEWPI